MLLDRFNNSARIVVWFFGLAILPGLLFANVALDDTRNETSTNNSLREIQQRVVTVVATNMETVVAISDGLGFGSGVIVSEDGLVLTAGHVVSNGDDVFEIYFPSGRTATARLVGYNLDVDAAMLRLEGNRTNWQHVQIAKDDNPQLSEWVVGLGHSGGYELGRKPPVRTGRVLEVRDSVVVTDSVLIGGDSGGPLFNLNGELVGIHSSIGDVISENRHVSMGTFRKYWRDMESGKRWGQLPELGGDGSAENANGTQEQENSKAPVSLGIRIDPTATNRAIVGEVVANSPAERVGIRRGDTVIEINGQKIIDQSSLDRVTQTLVTGAAVNISIRRNQSILSLVVILDQF